MFLKGYGGFYRWGGMKGSEVRVYSFMCCLRLRGVVKRKWEVLTKFNGIMSLLWI
jgi:hypothetical protein